jgi:isoleucyl-tRNA synthetase
VVNGLILAEDGRKMSKSLKNYPDPFEIFDEVGADALRAFMINSPVLRAEPLRFSRDGVREVVRTVLLPLWNAYSFFTTYAEADGLSRADLAAAPAPSARPEMDRWLLSVLQSLVADVNQRMEGYYLYDVVPPILGFVDDLTNWYVRRGRRRFWRTRGEDDADKLAAFATLYEVLVTFVEVVAPVLPFISEHIYRDLVARLDSSAASSVHHRSYPSANPALIDVPLEQAMATVREVVRLGHSLRKQHQLKVRRPLAGLTVVTHDPAVVSAVNSHQALIAEELNVKSVEATDSGRGLVTLSAKANFRSLGPRLGARTAEVAALVVALGDAEIERLLNGESIVVGGVPLAPEDVLVDRIAEAGMIVAASGDLAVTLDLTSTPALKSEGIAREVVSRIQQLRREMGLAVSDRIELRWAADDEHLASAILEHSDYIIGEVLATVFEQVTDVAGVAFDIDGTRLRVELEPAVG